jgi:hypothetical protein
MAGSSYLHDAAVGAVLSEGDTMTKVVTAHSTSLDGLIAGSADSPRAAVGGRRRPTLQLDEWPDGVRGRRWLERPGSTFTEQQTRNQATNR